MGVYGYAKKKWQEHEVARITGRTKRRKQNQEIKAIADAAAFKERKRTAASKAVAYEKGGGFWGSVSKGVGNLADNLDKNTRKKGKGKKRDPLDLGF